MNRNDLELRAQHVMVEMGRLAQFDKPSATQKATFDALAAEFEEIEGEIRADRLNGLRAAVNGTGRTRLEAGAFGAAAAP